MPTIVDLICEYCQKPFNRRLADVNNCKRRGFLSVACSRQCGLALRNRAYSKTEKARAHLAHQSRLNNKKATKSPLERFFTRTLNSAQRTGKLGLSREDLQDLWTSQNGLCAISGIIMEIPDMLYDKHKNTGRRRTHLSPWRASLDRIDSSKGYVPGNVQFVCTIANIAKADFSMDQLNEFCSWVHSKNLRQQHCPSSLS